MFSFISINEERITSTCCCCLHSKISSNFVRTKQELIKKKEYSNNKKYYHFQIPAFTQGALPAFSLTHYLSYSHLIFVFFRCYCLAKVKMLKKYEENNQILLLRKIATMFFFFGFECLRVLNSSIDIRNRFTLLLL